MNAFGHTTPALDPIDAAFVHRAARLIPAALPSPPVHDASDDEQASRAVPNLPASALPAAVEPVAIEPVAIDPASTVGRLLAIADDQWQQFADRVAGAHRAGSRVIAVAGGARSEGRTTVVDGLAATLRARGTAVMRLDAVPYARPEATDGSTIVLVDAGIWFPPGPIRVARVAALAHGCDAAILVRRAGEPPCPARGAVLARLGITCLGEVETFVP